MIGAKEYAELFETGQHGRLYLVSGRHARGRTFQIFILPEGEEAIQNSDNAPLNKDAVEVYGVVHGQPGWNESYGWLYEGKWETDFIQLAKERYDELSKKKCIAEIQKLQRESTEYERKKKLLDSYQ
jgi:hypothetical protein